MHLACIFACRYGAAPPPDRGPSHIDVFQNFNPPAAAADGGAASAHAAPAAASGPNALSAMFKPPEGLLYHGDFDAAKTHAADKGCWLLVNVQTADEFASHRLNRDTWGNDLVQDMVRESFVLWQVRRKCSHCGHLVGVRVDALHLSAGQRIQLLARPFAAQLLRP